MYPRICTMKIHSLCVTYSSSVLKMEKQREVQGITLERVACNVSVCVSTVLIGLRKFMNILALMLKC